MMLEFSSIKLFDFAEIEATQEENIMKPKRQIANKKDECPILSFCGVINTIIIKKHVTI